MNKAVKKELIYETIAFACWIAIALGWTLWIGAFCIANGNLAFVLAGVFTLILDMCAITFVQDFVKWLKELSERVEL